MSNGNDKSPYIAQLEKLVENPIGSFEDLAALTVATALVVLDLSWRQSRLYNQLKGGLWSLVIVGLTYLFIDLIPKVMVLINAPKP